MAQTSNAWTQQISTYLPELRRRALRLTREPSRADDLVQDTVVRALSFASTFAAGSNLRSWLHQILFSVFVSGYRRQRRERTAMQQLGHIPDSLSAEAPPSPERMRSLTRASDACLQRVPCGYRQVIELVDLGDRSYREAADELGVPLGTVMSRLHRGRRLLATQLGAQQAA